ncbi:hypothetical protein AQUCO_01000639v1 [Aquilegia coerulea]|uniref:BED-type domain-containing protein n=1 Tax=Aquilegia coerulea TaxID=218851 RepID=A0A2G5EB18_AQUCA|nr:hypothetical protein AQUCO_01000639v1 [Aquilegia coerulea]
MPKAKHMAWKHCSSVDGNHNAVTCKYCGRTFLGGGITRFKRHLASGDPNVKICAKTGKDVRNLFRQVVDQAVQRRNAKAVAEKNFQDALLHIDDSDEDEYSDEDPELRDFQRRRHSSFVGSNKERGSGSGSGSRRQTQSSINNLFRSGSVTSRSRRWGQKFKNLFTKMAHYDGINANQLVGSNPYTQPAIDAACRAGLGVRILTAYELLGPQLDIIVGECDKFIDELKQKKWAQYGVTAMCDGWTGPTKHSLINFMVYCDGDSCFIKSVDVSAFYKDASLILEQMKAVVDKVGKRYVVQIVTDNEANYKKAGEDLCKLLTGCAAHSIGLILKEFCRKHSVKKVIMRARKITKYIYNHSQVCDLMREICGGDIVRPALTRFVANFLALQRLLMKQECLKDMIIHPKWIAIRTRTKDQVMVEVEDLINSRPLWRKIKCICDSFEPMVETLRKVDDDKVPKMGFLYKWMENLKEKLRLFRQQTGSFGNKILVRAAEWWINYGYDAPSLRKVAVRILAQTVASSGCKRNWSTFDKLDKLVFSHYNLRLKQKNARRFAVLDNEPVDLTLLYPRVDASDSDDAPMDWVKFEVGGDLELDEAPRVPNAMIANELGVNVQDNILPVDPVHTQLNVPRSGKDDPLGDNPNIPGDGSDLFRVHVPSGSPSSSDDGGTGGVISSALGNGVAGSSRVYESFSDFRFTGESQFDHATQDDDHGATPIPKRHRQRRLHPTDETESSRVEDSPSTYQEQYGYNPSLAAYLGDNYTPDQGSSDSSWNTPYSTVGNYGSIHSTESPYGGLYNDGCYPNPLHPYSQSDYPPRDGAWFPDANQWLSSMTSVSDVPSLDTA